MWCQPPNKQLQRTVIRRLWLGQRAAALTTENCVRLRAFRAAMVAVLFTASAPAIVVAEDFTDVQSVALKLILRAPVGWIVRHLEDGEEHSVVISRELLDGFPRFHAALSVRSANVVRRNTNVSPTSMARGLCAMAQRDGGATTRCRESMSGRFVRVEWNATYPAQTGGVGASIAWVAYLADDDADELVSLLFEAPQSEWDALEPIARELMTRFQPFDGTDDD
jgi:hypothetical protein